MTIFDKYAATKFEILVPGLKLTLGKKTSTKCFLRLISLMIQNDKIVKKCVTTTMTGHYISKFK